MRALLIVAAILLGTGCSSNSARSQSGSASANLDEKVKKFLDSRAGSWRDMNVPVSDGQALYDIIVKNKYKSALEIGTSTGHSSIWIAWALSKTGGKLITVEISEARHKEAMANFREAGVLDFIDARLADAHELVPQLKGPFDFVFSDADKDWYKKYFLAVDPNLKVGGCFTAHNVRESRGGSNTGLTGTAEYYSYIKSLPNYETTVISSGNGLAVSYKKSE